MVTSSEKDIRVISQKIKDIKLTNNQGDIDEFAWIMRMKFHKLRALSLERFNGVYPSNFNSK